MVGSSADPKEAMPPCHTETSRTDPDDPYRRPRPVIRADVIGPARSGVR
jgi:hypothetical protein